MKADKANVEVGYGMGKGSDAFATGAEAAQQAMVGVTAYPLSAVLVFASVCYDLEAVLRGIHSVVDGVPVLGTTTAGEICNGPQRESVVVVALASPYLSVRAGVGEAVSVDWRRAVTQAVSAPELRPFFSPQTSPLWPELIRQGKSAFAFLFSPGSTRHADSRSYEILEELKRLSQGQLPIFGGGSADDWRMEQNAVFLGQQTYPDSVLVAVFETQLRFGLGLAHGFQPSSWRATVTRSQGREVLELDEKPAAEVYAQLLDTPVEALEGQDLTLMMGLPLGNPDPYEQYPIHVATRLTPQRGVRFTQPVPEGTVLAVMEANENQVPTAGEEATRKTLLRGGIADPAAIFVFSSALWARALGDRSGEEISGIKEMRPHVPIVGFYSLGEQSLTDNGVNCHNNDVIAVLALGHELSYAAQVGRANNRLEEELRRRTAQLEALREVGLEIATQLDLDKLLHSIVARAVELLGGTAGGMYLYDSDRDVLEWVMAIGPHLAPPGTILHRGEGLSGKVLETSEPLFVDDYRQWEGRAEVYEGYPFTAVVGVPVCWGDELLGVLNVNADTPRAFSSPDAELLDLFATQAAIAIRNARLFEETRHRTTQLEALQEISLSVTAQLDRDELLQDIVEWGCRLLDIQGGSLYLVDEKRGGLKQVVSYGYKRDHTGSRMEPGEGIAGKILLSGEPMTVDDYSHWEGRSAEWEDEMLTVSLSVPLRYGEQIIGTLGFDGITRTRRFDEQDVWLATLFANQAAIAIENARLYEEAQRRALEQVTLREAILALTTTLDRDEVIERILAQLQRVVPYDTASVQLLRDGQLEIVGGRGFPNQEDLLGVTFDPTRDDNPNREVVRNRAPFIVEDAPILYQRFRRDPHAPAGIRSWLGVPMLVGERLIGMIALDKREPGFYTEEHARLAEAFAAQAAIAIENSRLFHAEREQRELTERLRETAVLVSSSLDLREVLEMILDQLNRVIPYDSGTIQILEGKSTRVIATRNLPSVELDRRYPLDQFPYNRQLVRGGKPIVIRDVRENDQGWIRVEGLEHVRANIGAPLQVRGRVIGILTVDSRQPNAYSEPDARLVQMFAQQAAAAVENARLFQAEREQRELTEALEEAAAIVSSTLDLDRVLDRILEQVERVVAGDAFNVMLIEGDSAQVVRWRGYERMGAEELVANLTLSIADFSNLERMMQTKEPIVIMDTTADPNWVEVESADWICSYVAAPIQVGDKTVGFLNVDGTRPDQFVFADSQRLRAFADHAATAIQNARLYQETVQQLGQAEVLREMMLAAASTLDFDQILDRTIDTLERTLGIEYLGFMLPDEDREFMKSHPSMLGFTPPPPERTFRFPMDQCVTGQVYRTGKPVLLSDVRDAENYAVASEKTRSELAVPVKIGDEVVAVLNLESSQIDAFDEEDVVFYTAVAGQLGVAMENAHLYRELHRHAVQLEALVAERTAELQAQYAQLETILRSTADGIVVIDERGSILRTNLVARRWLTQTLSPEEASRLRKMVRNLAARAEEQPMEGLELGGIDLELKAAPILEPDAGSATAVVAIHDVSHLKALDRMKTRFITGVSHELRTPITTIKLYAHLMEKYPEQWREYLIPLTREADHQARLVEDILHISHIDTGRLEMKPHPTSLNELTGTALASRRAVFEAHGLTLKHRPAESGPMALVDPQRMMQILRNLLENALYYSPEGGQVAVSTGRREAKGRMWATVTVTDEGMGIPEDELPHVFERFFRGEEARAMQLAGTGLGLAIVKEIVELHGGWVTADSEEDVGSTFTVWLPLAE